MQKNRFLLLFMLLISAPQSIQPVTTESSIGGGVGPVNVKLSRVDDVDGRIYLAIIGLMVAGKVAYDVSWHSTYANSVNIIYQNLKYHVQAHNITSSSDPKLYSFSNYSLRDEVALLEKSLENSYNRWIYPWNWTTSQKAAHHKIQMISILVMYAALLKIDTQVSGQDILKFARNSFGLNSLYPYVTCNTEIARHIEFLKKFAQTASENIFTALLQDMQEKLVAFKYLLQEQPEFTLELQTKRTHELQQELVNATNARR